MKKKLTDSIWAELKYNLGTYIMQNVYSYENLSRKLNTSEIIYHYTDLNGLVSILENQQLYCTNIKFLNDKKEYNHGIELLLKIIESIEIKKENKEIFDFIKTNINRIYENDKYVTCFSKNGDLLSQWRAYANQGKGVALGFKSINIDESIAQYVSPLNITYNEEYQTGIISEFITLIISYFNEVKNSIDFHQHNYNHLVGHTIIEILEGTLLSFKHSTFSEEKEFRLEYRMDETMNLKSENEIFFKTSNSLITPFIKLKSKYLENSELIKTNPNYEKHSELDEKFPLKEIIIGPSLDFETNKIGIEILLKKIGYENIKIIKSKIPYRV
ncbi:hypothetical protein FHR24_003148 [Wenyingzhuangia heitensis]|uniref:DUF2971 domain-containing protein n=2 Tax=Wenyingzhuangia heitensis TaxID=1487859 RepID=A0ABX0UDZ6_9FLAO|nr:DUF2971 domain-containing protein [Wenyingzhuangia heitensis]NIJ46653.1 hypothetical protein [Wenyingzhuangia heitensis]